ncbi:MAG: BLUF domain-containing protein [Pseudomonadota bacterium]
MKCIFYSSAATKDYYSYELAKLAMDSASRNQAINITGYLFYQEQVFYQYLEGENTVLEALMEKLRRDTRHKMLKSFEQQREQRRFPQSWMSMGWPVRRQCNCAENALIEKMSMLDMNKENSEEQIEAVWPLVDELAHHCLARVPELKNVLVDS